MSFMNLPNEYSDDKSKFCILPIEYENSLTYGKGASKGSKEIIKASHFMEYYDCDYSIEPYLKGIRTLPKLKIRKQPSISMRRISSTTREVPDNKFPIILGGDHSITIGSINGLEDKEDFSVLMFDAHSDMFYSWNGSKLNHRCTAYNISLNHKTLLAGVRSMDKDEEEIIKQKDNVEMIKSNSLNEDTLKDNLENLSNNLYISIDVDVFDPSFIRNTGTPEPGGLGWNDILKYFELLFREKNVIGCDVVEFSPKYNFRAEAYSLSKLAYKIISMKQIFNKI